MNLKEFAKLHHEAWRKLPQNKESIFNVDFEKLPEEQKEKNIVAVKTIAIKILEEIEKIPKTLGLEELSKKYPEFVSYIVLSYNDFQKMKKEFL